MRPTYAEIDLSAVAHNIRAIKQRVHPAQVMAVVKADAYGHGVVPVARTALANGATYLGVALVEEGIELRSQGFNEPILVFGGAFVEQLDDFFRHNLEITIYTREIARALSALAKKYEHPISVHVKVDTGMGRVGVDWTQAVDFIAALRTLPGIVVKGLYTHFATSDERNKDYAHLQLARFRQVIQQLDENNIYIPLKHAANSGAILDLPETYLDMVRPGVMMYGYYPSPETSASIPIKPAMTLKSRVLFVKDVPANTSISYGRQYITQSPTRIATIPLGYADGYNRLLTNQSQVTIRGQRWPIVGRVCMDLIMADVGPNSQIQAGDEVIIFGRSEENAFSVSDICQLIGTIPYEVTCWVSRRVPRVYLG
ncbi:MAG: alanine racemase [candidate division KSB1 bacterium]|nr:alanine racemase [candidate division KSB1 bacterium]MDZ7318483.1 alanine racemase [candidate division KSB1 bacterium]MDZ7340616.1 alanine racemase [candidate division KSB1 bacterium]